MVYDSALPHRRSIRLKEYDYRKAGAYFITIVTQDRRCLFGEIADGEVRLSEAGRLARAVWESLSERFAGLVLDLFVVMPNHIHGIIVMPPPVGAPLVGARPPRQGGQCPGDHPQPQGLPLQEGLAAMP